MPNYLTNCEAFSQAAIWVWNWLSIGDEFGIVPGEESITDTELFYIAKACRSSIRTKKFSRAVESRSTGADWDWIIVDPQNDAVVLRVQAKKYDWVDERYEFGVTRSTSSSDPLRQVKLLIATANRLNRIPVYCLYSTRSTTPFQSHKQFGIRNESSLGCSFLPAFAVQARVSSAKTWMSQKDVDALHIPWQVPFCSERSDLCRVCAENLAGPNQTENKLLRRNAVGLFDQIVSEVADDDSVAGVIMITSDHVEGEAI